MKMPLSLVSLMPSNLAALWVKHNMALEAWNSMYNAVLMFALVGAMASIGVLVRSAQQYGKAAVLQAVLLVSGLLYLAVSFVPGAFFAQHPVLLVPVGALIGVGQALGFVLPDAMLADIIDYAELHSGSRDEGMYTVIETNLQQFVEIAGGVFPMVLLAGAGYEPLGGCSCGCGVSCGRAIGMPYARWHCPGDVGYSCTGKGGSELLFAPEEPAVAPCAAQSEHVQSLISLFFLAIPGLLALIAAIPAGKMPITARVHAAILAAIAARDSGGDAGEGGDAGGEREVLDSVYGEPLAVLPRPFLDRSWNLPAGDRPRVRRAGAAAAKHGGLAAARALLAVRVAVFPHPRLAARVPRLSAAALGRAGGGAGGGDGVLGRRGGRHLRLPPPLRPLHPHPVGRRPPLRAVRSGRVQPGPRPHRTALRRARPRAGVRPAERLSACTERSCLSGSRLE